jgi:hypothetical protein
VLRDPAVQHEAAAAAPHPDVGRSEPLERRADRRARLQLRGHLLVRGATDALVRVAKGENEVRKNSKNCASDQ